MARRILVFDPPERFVAGTIGQPGERVFYVQARGGGRLVSVALEKQQVAALAGRVTELLDEVRRRATGAEVPRAAPRELEDVGPLDSPVEEEFRGGTMVLAWEPEGERVVVEVAAAPRPGEEPAEVVPLSDDPDTGPDVLRVRLTPVAARAFVTRAERVVAAGRPPCPLCGLPLDPSGHVCPRQNGHRQPRLGA